MYDGNQKGDKISKLKCEHTFHNDCIMQWLKEYNYRCPVCRKECGHKISYLIYKILLINKRKTPINITIKQNAN